MSKVVVGLYLPAQRYLIASRNNNNNNNNINDNNKKIKSQI